jgi:hypothetical protein
MNLSYRYEVMEKIMNNKKCMVKVMLILDAHTLKDKVLDP